MKKLTKISLIVFLIGIVGLIAMLGIILGSGILGSKDKEDVIVVSNDIQDIELELDKASVEVEESDEIKIESYLNLWTDEDIEVGDVAVITTQQDVLTITETAPTNKFLGMFPQPYELKITIHAPADMIDDIDWRK